MTEITHADARAEVDRRWPLPDDSLTHVEHALRDEKRNTFLAGFEFGQSPAAQPVGGDREALARVILGMGPDFVLDERFPRQADALRNADHLIANGVGFIARPANELETTCARCSDRGEYLRSPGGSWWSHEHHPADGHDFEVQPPDPEAALDRLLERVLDTAQADEEFEQADADATVIRAALRAVRGLPTPTAEERQAVALAIARSMPGWNEDTTEPDIEPGPLRDMAEKHWRKVNKICLQQGREYADIALAVLADAETDHRG